MVRLLGRHARPTGRPFAVLAVGIIVGAIAGVVIWRQWHPRLPACNDELVISDPRSAVERCLQHHRMTADEQDLVLAVKAALRAGEAGRAERIARQMLAGARQGDAHNVLSYLAVRQGRGREAQLQAILASAAHIAVGDLHGLARDAVALSQADWRTGDFQAALRAADLGLALAAQLGDSHTEFTGYIARVDTLRRMGDLRAARETLATAIARAVDRCDRTWARLKHAQYLADAGQDAMALLHLSEAENDNRACKSGDVSSLIASNRVWLLRKADPAAALRELDALVQSDGETADTLVLRGILAGDRGDVEAAAQYLAQAETAEAPHSDWPWEIAADLAELSELRGGPLGDLVAEVQYRRSAAMVGALRATAQVRSAFMVSTHRRPYDGLIALLARSGRWRDALSVVLDLDASDMLRAVDRIDGNGPTPSDDPPSTGAAVVPAPDVDAVLRAWQPRDLVIVVARSPRQVRSGNERVYRLQIQDGRVTGEDVGDANEARRWATALFENPADPRAARQLGKMLVPPGARDRPLHVLAIGPLGKVPLAALRDDDGSLIIGRRPLVRVLALRAAHPESTGGGPAVVIADPKHDLPGAAQEGDLVATALGGGARLVGPRGRSPATRSELWAARRAGLLHIAGHVVALGSWRVLPLLDGNVAPAEILRHGLAPRIAVVASCGSAAAMDEEGWGSIAAALLDAGTAQVVATDRLVDDTATLAMMRAFYAQADWSTDPARALARVQQARDAAAPGAPEAPWAAFSVLGRPPFIP